MILKNGSKVFCERGDNQFAVGELLKRRWRFGWTYVVKHSVAWFQERDAFEIQAVYPEQKIHLSLPEKGEVITLWSDDFSLAEKIQVPGCGWFGNRIF